MRDSCRSYLVDDKEAILHVYVWFDDTRFSSTNQSVGLEYLTIWIIKSYENKMLINHHYEDIFQKYTFIIRSDNVLYSSSRVLILSPFFL